MKLVTREQMKACDEEAINTYHIPSILLMEQAAYSVFQIMETLSPGLVTVVCGNGNNGGDGFALARQLFVWSKHQVRVVMVCEEEALSEDAKIYYRICQSMYIPVIEYNSKEYDEQLLKEADYLVDALFGTGLTRPIKGSIYHMIEAINESKIPVISIDIPSGVCANTGKILGIAVKASKTVTFALPKIGLYVYPGIGHVGEVICTQIGIPKQILETINTSIRAITTEMVKNCLPERPIRSNKGTYGKVLVVGGQRGMSGAITLTAQSALKIGAGLVTAAVPRAIHEIVENKLTEVMSVPLSDIGGHLGIDAITELEGQLAMAKVVVVGPGMGRSPEMSSILREILKIEKPCIIDADGLFALKSILHQLEKRQAPVIITPHPGELSRLMDIPIGDLLEEPIEYTEAFAKKYGITVVFKTERTVISNGKETLINTTGNPGLAKGGSGDVLAGMIGGMLAQGVTPIEASMIGVYTHGMAADLLMARKSVYTLLPSDLIEELDQVFHHL
ncbi:MAG: NAD(P)H-hydrate dehydratase [Cellulosilyticaceae bacterium]